MPLCGASMEKICDTLMKVSSPVLLAGRIRPLYRWSAAERDAIVGRMPVFDRWGPLAEGSESREDNPYALDATEGGDGGLDDSEPPSPVESSAPARRRSMVVSSDDEMEDSDAGPQASPSQHAEVVAGGTGETQERSSEALPAGRKTSSGPVEALGMMPPREAPRRRPQIGRAHV